MEDFDKFTPSLKFTCESGKKNNSLMDFGVSLSNGKLSTDLLIKSKNRAINICIILHLIQNIPNDPLFTVQHCK